MNLTVLLNGTELEGPFLLRRGGFTEGDYYTLFPENRIVEFVDGEIIMQSPASHPHQKIVGFLTTLMRAFCSERGLGEVINGPYTMRLRENMNYEPDIFFVHSRRIGRLKDKYLDGPADMVIEILSESTRSYDLREKSANYADHGVKEYWAIDPMAKSITVHELREGRHHISKKSQGWLSSSLIRGFRIDVSWLWQENLPPELACLKQIVQ